MQNAEQNEQLTNTKKLKEMNVTYYHISKFENKDSIIKNGIIANEGDILLCTNPQQFQVFAANLIFTNEYSIFEIDMNGITPDVSSEEVYEAGLEVIHYVNQDNIAPKFICHIKDELWNKWELKEYLFRLNLAKDSFSYEQITSMLKQAIRLSEEWCNYYNEKNGTNIVPLSLPERDPNTNLNN